MGTLLLLAATSQQLLLYWPKSAAPPSGWPQLWTWQNFVALSVSLLALILGFAAGWLCSGIYRRRKQAAPKSEDLDHEINNLTVLTVEVESAVNNLYKTANITPQTSKQNWSRKSGDVSVDVTRVEQLQSIKRHIADLKSRIEKVNPWLAPSPLGKGAGKSDASSTPKREHPPAHSDIEEMEWFSKHDAAQDSRADSIAIDRSYTRSHSKEEQLPPERHIADGRSRPGVGAELVEFYNRAVKDPDVREQFRDKFPAIRLGTVNAVERRQNPGINAEFKETTDGDFLAFAIPGKQEYFVVPSLGLTIESVGYTAGALGEVFRDTQGYDTQRFYSNYSVRRPAIFKRDGDRWELCSPGELELGPGD